MALGNKTVLDRSNLFQDKRLELVITFFSGPLDLIQLAAEGLVFLLTVSSLSFKSCLCSR